MYTTRKDCIKTIMVVTILITSFLMLSKACYITKADASMSETQGVELNTTTLSVNKVIKSPEVISNGDIISTELSSDKFQSKIIQVAKKYLGVPYVYGANGTNAFDCSGFTKYVFQVMGYTIPRTSQTQYGYGKKVSKAQLQTGDLVFFNTDCQLGHVGIYIGDGDFIHASCSKGVTISSLSYGYYNDRFAGGTRIIR